MIIPFIALVLVIVLIIWFIAGAQKRNSKGKDMGEPGRTMGTH